jgi:signal peptidase I
VAGCGEDKTTLRVPSESMLPAYAIGDEVELDESAYDDSTPEPGDVVAFLAPRGVEEAACGVRPKDGQSCPHPTPPSRDIRLLARVVAGPGERVAFREGIAIVDGEVEDEKELRIDDPGCRLCDLPVEITVPPEHVFVAGDNRSAAVDSRSFGPVPYDSVAGRVAND